MQMRWEANDVKHQLGRVDPSNDIVQLLRSGQKVVLRRWLLRCDDV